MKNILVEFYNEQSAHYKEYIDKQNTRSAQVAKTIMIMQWDK